MRRYVLRSLERAAVSHALGNAGRPKGVAANVRGDARGDGPTFDHPQRVVPVHPVQRHFLPATDRAEEGSRRLVVQPGGIEILQKILLGLGFGCETWHCYSVRQFQAVMRCRAVGRCATAVLAKSLTQLTSDREELALQGQM